MEHVAGDHGPRGKNPGMPLLAWLHRGGGFDDPHSFPCKQHEHTDILIIEQAGLRRGKHFNRLGIIEAKAGGEIPQGQAGQQAKILPSDPLRQAQAFDTGADDDVCPARGSIAAQELLTEAGYDATYVEIPDANHWQVIFHDQSYGTYKTLEPDDPAGQATVQAVLDAIGITTDTTN